jgi:lactoylglutathione lyase
MRIDYAIVFVSDMTRSVAFYRDVIGVPLKFETPGWSEFVTEGATLALHASEDPIERRDDPRRMPAGRCRTGFSVADIDAFHRRMLDHEVTVIQEPTPVHGVRIAQYLDPDGMTFGVAQAATESEPSGQ